MSERVDHLAFAREVARAINAIQESPIPDPCIGLDVVAEPLDEWCSATTPMAMTIEVNAGPWAGCRWPFRWDP